MTDTATAIRRTRKTKTASKTDVTPVPPTPAASPTSKLDQLAALLMRDGGATVAELTSATGWQQHSVRGAIAGALRKRGLVISSEKVDGVRRYRATVAK